MDEDLDSDSEGLLETETEWLALHDDVTLPLEEDVKEMDLLLEPETETEPVPLNEGDKVKEAVSDLDVERDVLIEELGDALTLLERVAE